MPRLLLHSFNGLFSRTTWVSRYQKGKTSLDLNEARDDGVLGISGISWTICKQSAPHCRQIATSAPHHSIFYRLDTLPDTSKVSKHWSITDNQRWRFCNVCFSLTSWWKLCAVYSVCGRFYCTAAGSAWRSLELCQAAGLVGPCWCEWGWWTNWTHCPAPRCAHRQPRHCWISATRGDLVHVYYIVYYIMLG